MTTTGSLEASVLSQPVFDSSTQQFALVLVCGHFTYLGRPPFDVQWTVIGTIVFLNDSSLADEQRKEMNSPQEEETILILRYFYSNHLLS